MCMPPLDNDALAPEDRRGALKPVRQPGRPCSPTPVEENTTWMSAVCERPKFLSASMVEPQDVAVNLAVCRTGKMGLHSPFFFGVPEPPPIGWKGSVVIRIDPQHLSDAQRGLSLAQREQVGGKRNQVARVRRSRNQPTRQFSD